MSILQLNYSDQVVTKSGIIQNGKFLFHIYDDEHQLIPTGGNLSTVLMFFLLISLITACTSYAGRCGYCS